MQSLVNSERRVLKYLRGTRSILPQGFDSASPCLVTKRKYNGMPARTGDHLAPIQGSKCPLIESPTTGIGRVMPFGRIEFRSVHSTSSKCMSLPFHSTSLLYPESSVNSAYSPRLRNIFSFSSSRSSPSIDGVIEATKTQQRSDPQLPKQSETSYDSLIDLVTGNVTMTLSATWLRENCRCADCYYDATNQRKVLFHHLGGAALTATDISSDKDHVNVTWGDGHASRYNLSWLKISSAKSFYDLPPVKRVIWSNQKLLDQRNICRVKYEELVTKKSKEGRRMLLEGLVKFGFAFVDGTPLTADATIEVASQICAPLRTLYGDRWTFGDTGEELAFADTAYTSEPLGAHTDGTYYRTPPGVQILHCLGHEGGSGGESLLVDGFNAAEDLHSRDPVAFKILTQQEFDHQYIDEINCLHSSATVLKVDPLTGGLEWIRYNPYDRSPLVPSTVCHSTLGAAYNALARLGKILESPENQFWTKLRPGSVMLMDNWRVLHGRAAYSGRRVMTGCYLGRDEWLSAARLAGVL